MGWAGQFNLDFPLKLILSTLWLAWLHPLSWLINGNTKEILIGNRGPEPVELARSDADLSTYVNDWGRSVVNVMRPVRKHRRSGVVWWGIAPLSRCASSTRV